MSQVPLAPPPQTGQPIDGWLFLLWKRLTATGQLLWSGLSFTGSNLTDIETRNHADLQNLDTASYSHLTSTQVTDLTDGGDSTLHYHSADRVESISVIAGAALGGHRIVYLDSAHEAQYASNQTTDHALTSLGMTLGAVAENDTVEVQRSGEVVEPTWSWTLNVPVYLGDNGQLTQTPPTTPALFQRIIGFPTAATKLYLSFREPVFIA